MHLLNFVSQSWWVSHQPRCCGYPLPVDGEHQFPLDGVPPSKIGPHFLHSSGSMTLHQDGISDCTIKNIVWWRSKAFLIYLQVQFLSFSKILTVSMKDVMWFSSTARSLSYSYLNFWIPIGPFLVQFHFLVHFHLSFLLSC